MLLTGCKDKSTDPGKIISGEADFTTYAAIGNSVTAGFQSNSLYEEGQLNSYPNLIARQVNTSFTQPIISEPGIHTFRIVNGVKQGEWFRFDREFDRGELTNAGHPLPYNNLGVPGARVKDVLHTTNTFNAAGGINPFFDLILRNYDKNYGTQFEQAKMLKPTFLTVWIGNNDILGYAMGGAAGGDPISGDEFYKQYKELIDSIKTLNAHVLTANIPDVTILPYFTAISVSGSEYDYFGQTKTGIRKLIPGKDFITLPASELIFDAEGKSTGKARSQSDPLADRYVLDESEVVRIRLILNTFNSSIQILSTSAGFHMVDLYSAFNIMKQADLEGGSIVNGIRLKTDYVTGGLFSLDGIHPSNRGQAIIANEFIKVINQKYNASIPLINLASIPGEIQLTSSIR